MSIEEQEQEKDAFERNRISLEQREELREEADAARTEREASAIAERLEFFQAAKTLKPTARDKELDAIERNKVALEQRDELRTDAKAAQVERDFVAGQERQEFYRAAKEMSIEEQEQEKDAFERNRISLEQREELREEADAARTEREASAIAERLEFFQAAKTLKPTARDKELDAIERNKVAIEARAEWREDLRTEAAGRDLTRYDERKELYLVERARKRREEMEIKAKSFRENNEEWMDELAVQYIEQVKHDYIISHGPGGEFRKEMEDLEEAKRRMAQRRAKAMKYGRNNSPSSVRRKSMVGRSNAQRAREEAEAEVQFTVDQFSNLLTSDQGVTISVQNRPKPSESTPDGTLEMKEDIVSTDGYLFLRQKKQELIFLPAYAVGDKTPISVVNSPFSPGRKKAVFYDLKTVTEALGRTDKTFGEDRPIYWCCSCSSTPLPRGPALTCVTVPCSCSASIALIFASGRALEFVVEEQDTYDCLLVGLTRYAKPDAEVSSPRGQGRATRKTRSSPVRASQPELGTGNSRGMKSRGNLVRASQPVVPTRSSAFPRGSGIKANQSLMKHGSGNSLSSPGGGVSPSGGSALKSSAARQARMSRQARASQAYVDVGGY